MTQYEKSCSTLELPAILEQLAQQAVSASAKERAWRRPARPAP